MDSLDYQYEVESLRSNLLTANSVATELEAKLNDLRMKYDTDCCKYEEKLQILTERYERLMSSHQRLSKLNHELEEHLLNTIEKSTSEIQQLTEELESTKNALRHSQQSLNIITQERDRCKEDCISAVRLLQANPNQFLSELPRPSYRDIAWNIWFYASPSNEDKQILSNLNSGDCSQGASSSSISSHRTSIFSTFLPTFPPVGLFNGLQMESNSYNVCNNNNPNNNNKNNNYALSDNRGVLKSSLIKSTLSSKSSTIVDL
uniref:Uncharacterized protein n=1 Tax=Trichobilharzia regenti TaxID=157069 RepID=A0AA85K4X1_TRIRE|nr:unnamed protein product [Trichobilharzia regenti]